MLLGVLVFQISVLLLQSFHAPRRKTNFIMTDGKGRSPAQMTVYRRMLRNSGHSGKEGVPRDSSDAAKKSAMFGTEGSGDRKVRHIVFLKVHKAASTTVQNLLFRFGYSRGLDFVLPATGHYFSTTTRYHRVLLPPARSPRYDIFNMHCAFNLSQVSAIMRPGAVYLAIVRRPWPQFLSAYHYYRSVYNFSYLANTSLEKLVTEPGATEDGVLTYTMNSMARDFGFQPRHYKQSTSSSPSPAARDYLHLLDQTFHLVMVAEYFDESLVLMRRLLNWDLKDILYISKNVRNPEASVSGDVQRAFKERNRLDFLVYEFFLDKFQRILESAGQGLQDETDHFRQVLKEVTDWCNGGGQEEWTVEASPWSREFTIDRAFCKLMQKKELAFVNLLRKQRMNYQDS